MINLRVLITENIRIFNETNINRFSVILDEQCGDEVYEQSNPDVAFTMFIEKLRIYYYEAFPIFTRVIPNSKINGWFDAKLQWLEKDKRASYLRSSRKSDVESKIAYHQIKTTTKESLKQKNPSFSENALMHVEATLNTPGL